MSVINEDIYELSDLHEAIENDDKKTINKATMQFIESASIIIDNDNPFISGFLSATSGHRYISYMIQAPAAVLVTTDGKKSIYNLYANPIIIDKIYNDYYKNHDGNFFEDFASLIKHEMLHLIYNHQAEEEEFIGKNNSNHQYSNLAQDIKINTSKELMDNEWIKATGITKVDQVLDGQKFIHYDTEDKNWLEIYSLFINNNKKIKNRWKNNGINMSSNQSLQGNSSNNDNSNQSQSKDNNSSSSKNKDKNNKENSQSNNNKTNNENTNGNNSGNGSDVLNQVPSDVDQGDEQIADSQMIKSDSLDKIQGIINSNDLDEETIKSRGLLPGSITEQVFHIKEQKEVIDITKYYRHGLNKILKSKMPNRRKLALNTHRFSFKPTQKNEKGKEVLAYVDTSGSISSEEMQFFLSQLYSITKKYRVPLTAIPWGCEVHHDQEVEIKGSFKGEFSVEDGGTCANCVFEDLIKQKYDPSRQFVIILTDGETENIEEKNLGNYKNDVLWVIDDKDSIDENEAEVKEHFPGIITYLNDDRQFINAFPEKKR